MAPLTTTISSIVETTKTMLTIALLHRLMENPKLFDYIEMDPALNGPARQLIREGLLTPNEAGYTLTVRGHEYLHRVRDFFDRALNLKILANVNIGRALGPDLCDENGIVFTDKHDPRFITPDNLARLPDHERQFVVDMRIWAIEYVNELTAGTLPPISSHLVIFIQRLIDGEYADILTDLQLAQHSRVYRDIDEVVQTAYRIPLDLQTAREHSVQYWFEAAMHELTKQRGSHCGNPLCQKPLGVAEAIAREQNEVLNQCPHCQAIFTPPPAPAIVYHEFCPNCQSGIQPHHTFCPGCHSRIDRTLADGEIQTETTTQIITEYEEYYPTVVYYSPDPLAVLATWAALAIVF